MMAPPPVRSDPRVSTAETALKDASSKVTEQHGKVGDLLNRLIEAVNHALSKMGKLAWLGGLGGLAAAHVYGDKIKDAVERLKKVVEDVLTLVKKIVDEGIPVLSLITRAFDWLAQVQAPVAAMADTAATYTINLNNWSGPARAAYDQRTPLQIKGIDALSAAAGDMAGWLADLAAANAAYIMSLFKPLFDIAGALGAAAVDAVSIVGALEAIGKGGELIQIAVGAMYENLQQALGNVTGLISKMIDAKRTTGELGDSWPQMVTL